MGKRSNFERRERDFYPTPYEAVVPLLRHLEPRTRFIEPCAGQCDLINHLVASGLVCAGLSDIVPPDSGPSIDARSHQFPPHADYFITNPPWLREDLHQIIVNLSDQLPTWLLFDADWKHTKQAVPYLDRLRKVVSVGRVKWIPDSPFTGKDNCAWHLFDKPSVEPALFYGRAA